MKAIRPFPSTLLASVGASTIECATLISSSRMPARISALFVSHDSALAREYEGFAEVRNAKVLAAGLYVVFLA